MIFPELLGRFPNNYTYTTKNQKMTLRFSIKYIPGARSWRCYIVSPLDYRGRDYSSASAHWLSDGSPFAYICWSERIRTKDDAKAICDLWSEATERYIRRGGTFGQKGFRIPFIHRNR